MYKYKISLRVFFSMCWAVPDNFWEESSFWSRRQRWSGSTTTIKAKISIELGVLFQRSNFKFFLDLHYVWRSLDPTLNIWSNFVKNKIKYFYLLFSFASLKKIELFCLYLFSFFKKETTFFICIQLSAWLSAHLYTSLSIWISVHLFLWLSGAS